MFRLTISHLLCTSFVLAVDAASGATTILNFDSPVSGTIQDADGSGTGFTARLPGTGASIATNDPNLSLSANPGKFTMTSTHGNLAQDGPESRDLDILEAPGLFFPNVGTKDIVISADFYDVNVPNGSDQLLIYVGAHADKAFRAGFHDAEQYIFIDNSTGAEVGIPTALGLFNPGDDISLELSRTSGAWTLTWFNHTLANSGSVGPMTLPWHEDDLWIGVHAANALNPFPFVAIIDNFSVTIVPEPSSAVLLGVGIVSFSVLRRRRRRTSRSFVNC